MVDEGWSRAKCQSLDTKAADDLFFTGKGGKPHKANTFCSDCPILAQCLTEAIRYRLQGFWAGTTERERRSMEFMQNIEVVPMETLLPPEPTGRRIYRKVFSQPDLHQWMDEVEPSDSEILALEARMVS